VRFGKVWLDVELGSQYWLSDKSKNANFVEGLRVAGLARGLSLGVYTSLSQYPPIVGTYTGSSSLPLWYAHYDNNPSFSNFRSFNGWSQPTVKQFLGDKSYCSVGVDVNFMQ